jgi:hypothetical protein
LLTDQQSVSSPPKKEGPAREKLSLPPKRVDPLAGADLSAMRELAITSTRLAIQQHDVRKKIFRIMSGVFKILIAVMVGLILIVWGKSSHQWITLLGVLVVLGAGFYAFRHVMRRRRQTSGVVSTHRDPATESPARRHGAESRTLRA